MSHEKNPTPKRVQTRGVCCSEGEAKHRLRLDYETPALSVLCSKPASSIAPNGGSINQLIHTAQRRRKGGEKEGCLKTKPEDAGLDLRFIFWEMLSEGDAALSLFPSIHTLLFCSVFDHVSYKSVSVMK